MKPRKNVSAVVRAALTGCLALGLAVLTMGGCDFSNLPSGGGTPQPAPNNPPTMYFTRPASKETIQKYSIDLRYD